MRKFLDRLPARWWPLPEGHDGWHLFTTLHGLRADQWSDVLNPDKVQVLTCEANVHCDVRAMLHKKFGAPA